MVGRGTARSIVCILLVQSLSQVGVVVDFGTGAAFFRNLTDQSFVQLERETNGHLL